MSVRMFERGKTNMNRRYRKTIIAGNWKMNKTPAEAKALIEEMKPLLSKTKWCEMVLCVPFTDIQAAVKAAKGSKIAIGAENMHFEKSGAFTGEISADMLKELGVKYVIIGHSERRQYFNETDEACGKKVQVALENGLRPILCVGESLEERDADKAFDVVGGQIKADLTFGRTNNSQQRFFFFHFIAAHTFTLRDFFNLRLLHRLHQLLVLPVLLLRQPEIHF